MFDGLSQVLVIILLRRSWRLRTDLSTAVTAADGRHAGVQCSTPPEASRGHYRSLTPHAASSVPGPHYHDHFLQHLLFLQPCNTHQQELWSPQQRMCSSTGWSCLHSEDSVAFRDGSFKRLLSTAD